MLNGKEICQTIKLEQKLQTFSVISLTFSNSD